jgi:hypothetical protein
MMAGFKNLNQFTLSHLRKSYIGLESGHIFYNLIKTLSLGMKPVCKSYEIDRYAL